MGLIALWGPPDDQEVMALAKRLKNRGAEAVNINLAEFPGKLGLRFSGQGVFLNDLPLLDISASFMRNRGGRMPWYIQYDKKMLVENPEKWRGLYKDYQNYITEEKSNQRLRHSLLYLLAAKSPVINPLYQNNLHRLKSYLFYYLRKKGIPVPDFICSSHAFTMKDFAQKQFSKGPGAVIKPLAGIYKTKLWSASDWDNHDWQTRAAFYQSYIPGDTIRCYVVDDVFAAAARIVHQGTVDSSMSQTGIEVLDLPCEAKTMALSTAKALGLRFCGMDLMHDKNSGRYYVIDCNMSPMFVNFSRLSAVDIPAMIAEMLMKISGQEAPKRIKGLLGDLKSLLADDVGLRQKLEGR
ncbi:MAG: hypothetical protein JXR70_08260 [Spirochaetales bacterium]|nr:hypothetical protein [Spirochaetales bacterium]